MKNQGNSRKTKEENYNAESGSSSINDSDSISVFVQSNENASSNVYEFEVNVSEDEVIMIVNTVKNFYLFSFKLSVILTRFYLGNYCTLVILG